MEPSSSLFLLACSSVSHPLRLVTRDRGIRAASKGKTSFKGKSLVDWLRGELSVGISHAEEIIKLLERYALGDVAVWFPKTLILRVRYLFCSAHSSCLPRVYPTGLR
jgi:hypothetical protein